LRVLLCNIPNSGTAVANMAATAAARSLGKLKQQNVALFVCDLQVQQQHCVCDIAQLPDHQLLIGHQFA
jgi:hypothetical protein